ncbi:hypothetical protein ACIA8C_24115 [Nocardia sp. NPDC051321]
MEILVIIALVVLVVAVLVSRKRWGKRRGTSLSTGNPSANEGNDKI